MAVTMFPVAINTRHSLDRLSKHRRNLAAHLKARSEAAEPRELRRLHRAVREASDLVLDFLFDMEAEL